MRKQTQFKARACDTCKLFQCMLRKKKEEEEEDANICEPYESLGFSTKGRRKEMKIGNEERRHDRQIKKQKKEGKEDSK